MCSFPSESSNDPVATADFQLPAHRSSRHRAWLTILFGLLIFVAGGVCGLAAGRVTAAPQSITALNQIPARVADRMERRFGLSRSQRDQIEQIGLAHQADLHRIRAQIAPEMRRELREIIEEMAAVLTPAQAAQWRAEAQHRLDRLVPTSDVDVDSNSAAE